MSYYLTQALTGHGSFRIHLHGFQMFEEARCLNFVAEVVDAEHDIPMQKTESKEGGFEDPDWVSALID